MAVPAIFECHPKLVHESGAKIFEGDDKNAFVPAGRGQGASEVVAPSNAPSIERSTDVASASVLAVRQACLLLNGFTNISHNLLLVLGALGIRLGEGHCEQPTREGVRSSCARKT